MPRDRREVDLVAPPVLVQARRLGRLLRLQLEHEAAELAIEGRALGAQQFEVIGDGEQIRQARQLDFEHPDAADLRLQAVQPRERAHLRGERALEPRRGVADDVVADQQQHQHEQAHAREADQQLRAQRESARWCHRAGGPRRATARPRSTRGTAS